VRKHAVLHLERRPKPVAEAVRVAGKAPVAEAAAAAVRRTPLQPAQRT
jgi:hypothetical protein